MSIHHHAPDDLLLAYAAGDLDEGLSLVIATHLALCATCRETVRQAEAAGGALLEAIVPIAVGPEVLGNVLDRIDREVPPRRSNGNAGRRTGSRPSGTVHHDTDVIFPEPLRGYVGGDLSGLRWRSLGRGAYHVPVVRGDTTARLLRIPAGRPVPEHGHSGRELTLVLKGSFSDSRGEFRRGDLEDCDDTVHHQPIAGSEEDCICLAVTEAPLRFKSMAARVVQPFIGI